MFPAEPRQVAGHRLEEEHETDPLVVVVEHVVILLVPVQRVEGLGHAGVGVQLLVGKLLLLSTQFAVVTAVKIKSGLRVNSVISDGYQVKYTYIALTAKTL